ncbi:MAG: carbohydrate ABC transporter permease [Pseudolabrys sp.]|nr:carbohydrate ABC transporter permease [Pseudolabrys sp.]
MFPLPFTTPAARNLYRLALAVSLIVWLLPLFGIALTSLRPAVDLNRGNFWGWPSEIAFSNYAAIFDDTRMLRFMLNSVIVTCASVVGALTLACMAGFALAKYRFRGNTALLVMFIAGNLVPFQILMIPVRDLAIDVLRVYDTYLALIAFHVAFQTGFCTLFMRNFIRQLPDAVFDAARVDGLSELQIFWHVALPMVRPAIAALAALTFTFVWNDYFWSLVLVQSDDVRPLTAGLQSLRGMWLVSWQLIAAGSLLAALPPLLLFLLMQRQFIAGLTARGTGEN